MKITKATQKQWLSWERRAKTQLERAHQLSCDMIEALGVDAVETDFSDSVVEKCENLLDLVHRQRVARGKLK